MFCEKNSKKTLEKLTFTLYTFIGQIFLQKKTKGNEQWQRTAIIFWSC